MTVGACPACAADIQQKGILAFKRPYLCDFHRRAWDVADAADWQREAAKKPAAIVPEPYVLLNTEGE